MTTAGTDLGAVPTRYESDASPWQADVIAATVRLGAREGQSTAAIAAELAVEFGAEVDPAQVAGWLLIGSESDREAER